MSRGAIRNRSRRLFSAVLVILVGTALSACGSATKTPSQANSPTTNKTSPQSGTSTFKPATETIIVTANAGGGLDMIIRQLQPYLGKALGGSAVSVVDMPGGQSAVGANGLLNHGGSCSYMMITGIPQILYTFKTQKLPFSWSEFYPVASLTDEPTAIAVQASSQWTSLKALVDYAKAHPGSVSASVSQYASPDYVTLYQIEQAMGVKFNVVQFNGGGPARSALLGGHVQVTAAPVFSLSGIGSKVHVLAVADTSNKWVSITNNAPTVTEALGTNIPPSVAHYGLWVTQACQTQHPDQYQTLVKAVQTATQSSGFQAVLKSAHSLDSLNVVPSATFETEVQQEDDQISQLLKSDPKLFSGK